MANYKLGTLAKDGSDVPFRYDDIYEVQQTTGGRRLVIAPQHDQASLIADLADSLAEPYYLLYVLLVSRTGREEGRYESANPLTARDLRDFLSVHAAFLENDGRHHFWIRSIENEGLLVYDQHNVIYAYGPLDQFEQLLKRRGFRPGTVRFPAPHTHHYHASYDSAEDRLFADGEWFHSPLREQDEP